MITLLRVSLAAFAGVIFATPTAAHPHVWVTMTNEVIYAADGDAAGLRQRWVFDDMYSAYATQGIPSKVRGQFTREELASLAKLNIETLKESDYFTHATVDGKKAPFADPLPDYWLDYKSAILSLNFTLPFKHPVKAKRLKIEIYDPTIFVDFEFAKGSPVKLVGAPTGCKLNVVLPKDITAAQSQKLGEQFFNALTAAQNWGAQFANVILVNCP
jgi:ABC-type uncharacterized transport system substrate-binding protein